jgi:anti-anti-sigma regulatory factor
VIFDAISVTHIDTAGLDALADLTRELDHAGVELRIAAVKDYLIDGFEVAGIADTLRRERLYPTVAAASSAPVDAPLTR